MNDDMHASFPMTYCLMKIEIKWSAFLMGNDLAHGQIMNGYFIGKLLHHMHF